jgi:hypothetical protein
MDRPRASRGPSTARVLARVLMATFKTTHYAKATVTISGSLIGHVRKLYVSALKEVVRRSPDREAIRVNFIQHESMPSNMLRPQAAYETEAALPGYILAATAVEAFINEAFLSDGSHHQTGVTLSTKERERLEWLSFEAKLVEVPKRIFGRSLARGQRVLQNMKLLIALRHELVHYKMGLKPPKVVKELALRRLASPPVPPAAEDGGIVPWVSRVSTAEGLRWAHNTACATVQAIIGLAPIGTSGMWTAAKFNFMQINEAAAREWLREAVEAHEAEMQHGAEGGKQ